MKLKQIVHIQTLQNEMFNYTFLTTYFAGYDMLMAHNDSIEKYHPGAPKIMSRQDDFEPDDLGRWDKILFHDMNKILWAGVCKNLSIACETDIGIFIEHDCILMKSIKPLIDMVASGEVDVIGAEEVIEGLRFAPEMMCNSFTVINMKKLKELGLHNINVRDREKRNKFGYHVESSHGLYQTFSNKMYLRIKRSGYGYGTFYGDYAHHMWYGSHRKRMLDSDVDKNWLVQESDRLLYDYWTNNFKFKYDG